MIFSQKMCHFRTNHIDRLSFQLRFHYTNLMKLKSKLYWLEYRFRSSGSLVMIFGLESNIWASCAPQPINNFEKLAASHRPNFYGCGSQCSHVDVPLPLIGIWYSSSIYLQKIKFSAYNSILNVLNTSGIEFEISGFAIE